MVLWHKSCQTNLIEYLNTLTKLVDEGYSVDVIYLDSAKAFDKVPHRRLLLKLEANGISGKVLHWIQSWLTGRLQRVVLNSSVSDLMSVTSGVPSIRVGGRLPQSYKVYILTFGYLSKYLDENVHCLWSEFCCCTVFPLYRISTFGWEVG